MEKNLSYELILSGIEKVCQTIGIALNCENFASVDLIKLYEELIIKLGTNNATKILSLGEKIACGLNPNKELKKLQRSLEMKNPRIPEINLDAISPSMEISLNLMSNMQNGTGSQDNPSCDHWSNRTRLARTRLPTTKGHFAKWSPATIFRGPKTTRGK